MTLQEVRQYLQTLYSSSSESSDPQEKLCKPKSVLVTNNNKYSFTNSNINVNKDVTNSNVRSKKNTFLINIKNKKVKDSCDNMSKQINDLASPKDDKRKKPSPAKRISFKQALCNLFRFKRLLSPEPIKADAHDNSVNLEDAHNNISNRALPPLPTPEEDRDVVEEQTLDFATSIQRVKDVSLSVVFLNS